LAQELGSDPCGHVCEGPILQCFVVEMMAGKQLSTDANMAQQIAELQRSMVEVTSRLDSRTKASSSEFSDLRAAITEVSKTAERSFEDLKRYCKALHNQHLAETKMLTERHEAAVQQLTRKQDKMERELVEKEVRANELLESAVKQPEVREMRTSHMLVSADVMKLAKELAAIREESAATISHLGSLIEKVAATTTDAIQRCEADLVMARDEFKWAADAQMQQIEKKLQDVRTETQSCGPGGAGVSKYDVRADKVSEHSTMTDETMRTTEVKLPTLLKQIRCPQNSLCNTVKAMACSEAPSTTVSLSSAPQNMELVLGEESNSELQGISTAPHQARAARAAAPNAPNTLHSKSEGLLPVEGQHMPQPGMRSEAMTRQPGPDVPEARAVVRYSQVCQAQLQRQPMAWGHVAGGMLRVPAGIGALIDTQLCLPKRICRLNEKKEEGQDDDDLFRI